MSFEQIFTPSLIYATFRSATPIIFAALCAALTQQADILNIGTEGIMLMGAFVAIAASYFTGSWLFAILLAMIAGMIMASIMALGHLKYKADICAIGMGINLLALALTKFLLNVIFKTSGTFSSPEIVPIPRVHIAALENAGVLNEIFNDWAVTEWFCIVLVIALTFILFKTKWGLHLRAVGQSPMAAQTAGINVSSMKYQAILISGLIGGLAGAHLSLAYSTLFTENMTSSRGFMGVAAMFFGGAHPVFTSLGCLLFGFADSIGARLQAYGVASQIVLLMPYVVTIVVLAISMISQKISTTRKKSSLTNVKVTS